jgi:hypothetical protein
MSALAEGMIRQLAAGMSDDPGIGEAVVAFDLGGDGMIVLDGVKRSARLSSERPPADCTIKIAAPLLMKILAGEVPCGAGFMKFVRGVEGRPGLAVEVQPFLRRIATATPAA